MSNNISDKATQKYNRGLAKSYEVINGLMPGLKRLHVLQDLREQGYPVDLSSAVDDLKTYANSNHTWGDSTATVLRRVADAL